MNSCQINYARKKALADTFCLFFIWIHCKKVKQQLQGMKLQEKQEEKGKKQIRRLTRREPGLINSRCKANKIISQRKPLCW